MKPIGVESLPEETEMYFKEDKFSDCGWKMVYPSKNKEGKFLWKNILYGGSQNLFWIVFIVLLLLGGMYVYSHDTAEMQKVVADPCDYCNIDTFKSSSTIPNDTLSYMNSNP